MLCIMWMINACLIFLLGLRTPVVWLVHSLTVKAGVRKYYMNRILLCCCAIAIARDIGSKSRIKA